MKLGYNPETKQQLPQQWKSPSSLRPKSASSLDQHEIISVDLLFQQRAIVHKVFVPQGQTVNRQFCNDVLRWLQKQVQWKCSEMWANQSWV